MIAEARARGTELPLAERTLAVYDEASRNGWGSRDCTELPAYWASQGPSQRGGAA
jgi:3-hydroxyisobutyrate dehydrogenase